jgi:uncharacterized DUF497 family protein
LTAQISGTTENLAVMITWDEAKRRANRSKHGMDLADAADFDFDAAFSEEDGDVRHERRFRAVGPLRGRLCFLVYAVRDDGDVHAITLRRCEKKEIRRYVEQVRSLDRS